LSHPTAAFRKYALKELVEENFKRAIAIKTSGYLMDILRISKYAAQPRVSRAMPETEMNPPDDCTYTPLSGGWEGKFFFDFMFVRRVAFVQSDEEMELKRRSVVLVRSMSEYHGFVNG
jgi:hypothetical protein